MIDINTLECKKNNIDLDEYLKYREICKEKMEHPDWLGDFSKTDLENIIKEGSVLYMFYDHGTFVSSCMLMPASKKSIEKFELPFLETDTCDYGPMFVSEDYIGNGLQKGMFDYLDKEAKRCGYAHAAVTIHPDNLYSINNALKANFKYHLTKDFTRGTRNIYYKDIV